MEQNHWLKENWFKVGILCALVIIIVLGIYYLTFISKNNNGIIISQKSCSEKASEVFTNNTDEYERTYQNYTYTNHFSEKTGKCFVLITGGDLATEYHAVLYNAFDNKELGGVHTAMKMPGLCGLEINGSYKTCEHFGKEGYVTEAVNEFNDLAKVYMEN